LTRPNTFPIQNVSENIVAYSSSNLLFPVDGILSTTADYATNLDNYLLFPSHQTAYDIASFAPNLDAYISKDNKNLVILLEDGADGFDIEIEFLNKKP
jgi:hypothetical protein